MAALDRTKASAPTQHELRAALSGGDTITLLLCYVQISGDLAFMERFAPFVHGPWDYMVEVPQELRDELEQRMLPALESYWQAGTPPATELDAAVFQAMMNIATGEQVPENYMAMMQQQVAFGAKPEAFSAKNLANDANLRVAVIGAGVSGICAAIRLQEAGITYEVFEKNADVGGTWLENAYPGCGVDTPNHAYSYSFAPNHDWTHYFSKRDELLAYFRACAAQYAIHERISFATSVLAAHFHADRGEWELQIRRADGHHETHWFNAVIFAVGLLNTPSNPKIPGLDNFRGAVTHTASWSIGDAYRGKRVGLVGTGASGMQVGPSIAAEVEHLTVFQRTPHWVVSNPNYLRAVDEGKKQALRHIPFYANWYRFQLFWASADAIHAGLFVDPEWQDEGRSINAVNHGVRDRLIAYMRTQCGDDEDLLRKVTPDYPPYGKRMLRDNNWFATLRRPNVTLVTDGIERITETGVVTTTGTHDLDVLVLATGFSVGPVLAPIDVRGRDGISIREIWGQDDPRAYLGITVPKFPNMFLMYGPNTNLAHGGSALFHGECQINYILQALQLLRAQNAATIECRQDVHDAYNARVDAAHQQMVWSFDGVTSWYRNKAGRVFATTPWRMVDYWKWTSELQPADYILG